LLYFAGLATGLWVIALLLVGGGVGYAAAVSPGKRPVVLMVSGILVLLFGVTGVVLGSVAYSRVSIAAANLAAAQRSPTPATDSNPLPATDAWLYFLSDPRDYIGGGQSRLYTLAESDFTIRSTRQQIQVNVPGNMEFWTLFFRSASTGDLHAGIFNHAERAAFKAKDSPGLDVSGEGHGCNNLSGRFHILRLTWSAYGDVAAFDVVFEQHCEGMVPALRGELWIATQQTAHKSPPNLGAPITF
jgi:hypothetical protein